MGNAGNMINEDEFRKHVIIVAKKLVAHVSHIESHESSAGIPDLNLFLTGADLWIELKVIKAGRVKMRPTQKRWHTDRAEHGGKSWVLALDPRTQDVLVLPGHTAAALAPTEAAWRAASSLSNIPELSGLLITLARSVINAKLGKHGQNGHRTTEGTGSPASALPKGGKDVGGGHWLLDKP